MKPVCIKKLVKTALLAALLTVSGAIKLPGLFVGAEFQLSAPLAVAICAVYGFRTYFVAGMASSGIGFILGTQNLFNIFIACIFRFVAGTVIVCAGTNLPALILAGPAGTAAARIALSLFIGQAAEPFILAALPGMAYTAVCAVWITNLLRKIKK